VVLAAAGLARLGRSGAATDLLSPMVMLPAPAQGALAVEARPDLPDWLAAGLATLDDVTAHASAVAERAVLAELGAGCSAPVGALAHGPTASAADTPLLLAAGAGVVAGITAGSA